MKNISIFSVALGALAITSCNLLSPGDVQNPNVVESDFAASTDAMAIWVNGTNANFGACVSSFAEITAILSDDVHNNSSHSAKTYDVLDIAYTDGEVAKLSTHIGKMIEMADFGLETIAANDPSATDAERFNLLYIKAIAYLMGAENFVALPASADGPMLSSRELADAAMKTLDAAGALATNPALVDLLRARASRLMGLSNAAKTYAQRALDAAPQLLVEAQFDDINGYSNTLQSYVANDLFTILPRLAAQRVKCPQAGLHEQPIAVAKAEEAHLILAECAVVGGDLEAARTHLCNLLSLVQLRGDPSVTTVSLTAADVALATTREKLYETLYTLRQETFFAEGRRSSDMGIRLPLSEVEFASHGTLANELKQPVIPAYLDTIRATVDDHADLNAIMVRAASEIFPLEEPAGKK